MESITIQGNMFYKGNDRWAPKGLDYQPTDGVDPISDDNLATITALVADDGDFTKLGINALRIYQVDPTKSHDSVMALLESKGIYVMVGAVNSDTGLPRDGSYPCHCLDRCKAVVKAFISYPNVIGFSIANEVLNNPGMQTTAAAVKALARDTKAYIASLVSAGTATRVVPVGAALRDVRGYTWPAAKYYTCGPVTDRLDFIAYNVYVWCAPGGATSFTGQIDAYSKLYLFFKDFPVPVFWGENGCMNSGVREWKQVPYLFGNKEIYAAPTPGTKYNMADVIQGGFAFRYIMRNENSGLIYTDGSKTPDGGFDELATEYATVTTFGGTTPGQANSAAAKDCTSWADSDFNPSMPDSCGTSGNLPTTGTTVTLTNEVSPANSIQLLAYLAIDGAAAKYYSIATMNAGAAPMSVLVPTGTTKMMMIYGAENWPMGCQITDMDTVTEGCTIHGNWVSPNGQGTCTIS